MATDFSSDLSSDLSCEQCQDSLPWYVADALSHDERAAVERHLASCVRCRSALEEWREVALALHRASESIPTASPATWAHISRRLREQPAPTAQSNGRMTMRLQDRSMRNTSTPNDMPPVASPNGRRSAIVGLVAVVALIALSAGIFSYFATHGGSRRSTIAATPHPACAPSQATVNLPTNTVITAIAPLGTDDGWAVGTIADPRHYEAPPSAVLLRLRNCHWAPVGTPIPHAALSDIAMATADEGWAVGVTYAQNVTLSDGTRQWDWDQPLVLHYVHGFWQTVKVSAGPKTNVEKVKMVSANEGWMLLYDGKHPITVSGVSALQYGHSLLHYLNGTWTNVPLDFPHPSMSVGDLDARAPGEVWLVGSDYDYVHQTGSGFAMRYAGGAWTRYTEADDFTSVSVLSPTDVWAGGSHLYHFDGTRWTQVSVQGTRHFVNLAPGVDPSSFPLDIEQMVMLSPTQGWAIPSPIDIINKIATQEEALRYDHGVWQWTTLSLKGALTPLPLITRVAPSSATQGWAIAFQPIDGYPQYLLMYYDADTWGIVRQQS
ncbi:MAG TPA: zf-HC2 domain-containing protein [Ktedonobacterales bacterium]|jgi:hypothetical protein